MKKMYGTPKAEKVEFNYSDVVVASVSKKCKNQTLMTDDNTVFGVQCTTNPSDTGFDLSCTYYAEGF